MYLLDANVFIESKNIYYGFDTFPGFWEWLDAEQMHGHLASIRMICDELLKGNDDLREWAIDRKISGWFLRNDDEQTQQVFALIAAWVMEQEFRDAAKSEFPDCGDPWLIAKARVIGATVVTQETFVPGIKKKVKIPNVCRAFDVPYINIFELLRERSAVFIVGGGRQ